ncbi:MAG: hypothetical protein ISR48_04950 [Alphaproteobacteria bacterium]|nr:hypothetical protein [Alphaproteobacteria bacterium]
MKKETVTKILWALTLINTLILLSIVIVWACRHHGHHGKSHHGYHQGGGMYGKSHHGGGKHGKSHHGKNSHYILDLTGTWEGTNRTVSDLKGFKEWNKTVHITEQQDRRFKGNFTYADGTKHFSGVIYPGNRSFSWVSSDSKGYLNGRILGPNTISACYVESGEQSTAGCAELTRQGDG